MLNTSRCGIYFGGLLDNCVWRIAKLYLERVIIFLKVLYSHKGMVRSDMSKPALIFFFTARVHTIKSTVKILAVNTHCKYFLKIAEQYCNLPDPWRNVHP
jgi:hypothetical protein